MFMKVLLLEQFKNSASIRTDHAQGKKKIEDHRILPIEESRQVPTDGA